MRLRRRYILLLATIAFSLPISLTGSWSAETPKLIMTVGSIGPDYYKGFVVAPNSQSWPDKNGSYFGYSDLKQMKDWGATVVRIHAQRGDWIMPTEGNFSLSYFQTRLDRYVQNCSSLGLYCIVELGDWNWSSYFGSGSGMPDWFFTDKYPADGSYRAVAAKDFWDLDNPLQAGNRQWFIRWWEFIANRYKDNRWVMFSIYNEPLNPGVGTFANSTEELRISACYSRFMEQVYDAIRATGAEQTVIVNQPFVWSQKDIVKVNRSIIWDFHLYVSTTSSMSQWTNDFVQRYNRCVRDFGQPFIMLEFGLYPSIDYYILDYQTILGQQVSTLKQYGAHGWSWLEWGALAGEYGNDLTAEQSANVVAAVLQS